MITATKFHFLKALQKYYLFSFYSKLNIDNIAKMLASSFYYKLMMLHFSNVFFYVLLFRLQKVSFSTNILCLNIRKRFQFE